MKKKNQTGFTLLEMLVVIVIIGVLAGLGLRSFMTSQAKARDGRRKADLENVTTALEAYFNDKGRYPSATNGQIDGCDSGATCPWGEIWEDENGTIYMVQLPDDPSGGRTYFYDSDLNGTYYQLYARYENVLNQDVPKDVDDDPQVYENTSCAGSGIECNYGIASSNERPTTGHALIDD